MNILIKNANIVKVGSTEHGTYKGDIYIKGTKIEKIGALSETNLQNENIGKTIDANGKFVIPGFIQTHVHLCQTLFRGLAEDMELLDWLTKKIWPAEASHSKKSIEESVAIGLSELILSGTTTVVDMGTANFTERIFEVAKEAGIRAFIGNAMMDSGKGLPPNLQENLNAIINKSISLIEKYHGIENGRLKYILSPRFILSCSDDLFREVKKISESKNLLIQTHAAENQNESRKVVETKGKNEIQYFEDMGILNDNLIIAHCIWIEDEQMNLLSKNNVKIAHCPTANLKLGSGIAKVPEMLDLGINVSLGSDGAPCNNNLNMFNEMKLAGILQKYRKNVFALPAKKILEMATIDGAKTIHMEKELGSIEENKKADLVILDLNQPNTLPEIDDIYTRIVYSANLNNVETVVIDGNIVFEKNS